MSPDSPRLRTALPASLALPPLWLDPSTSTPRCARETLQSDSPPSLLPALLIPAENIVAHKSFPLHRPAIRSLRQLRAATADASAARPSVLFRRTRTAHPLAPSAARPPLPRFRDTPANPSMSPAPPTPLASLRP